MKGIKTIAANLANRINQPHHLEIELRKVANAGIIIGKYDKENLIKFIKYATPLLILNKELLLEQIVDNYINEQYGR